MELALDRLDAHDLDRALLLATLCAELVYGALERRQALADEALTIAQASGDDAVIVRVLHRVFLPLDVPFLLDESLARIADAMERAERLDDPVLRFWAADSRAPAAARSGDVEEMRRCIEIKTAVAEQLDQPTLRWVATYGRAWRAQIEGDNDLAEQLATDALQIGTESGQPDASTFFGVQFGYVSYQRGTLGELVPMLEQMMAEAPDIADVSRGSLALAHAEAGRLDDARRVLEEFAATDFDLPVDGNWSLGMISYALAASAVGDPRYAAPVFDRLEPWADQWATGGLSTSGPLTIFLGGLATVLGRYDDADGYFARAAESTARTGAKCSAALTDQLWGQMLAERNAPGDLDRARDLLTKAQTVAATNGYANVERRATEALQRLA